MAKEEKINACYLYSKLNYSVNIEYDGRTVVLPPFANKFKLEDEKKVKALPVGVRKVTIKEVK